MDISHEMHHGASENFIPLTPPLPELEAIWQALVLGVRDYVNKNHFRGVVLGLSGGALNEVELSLEPGV